MLFNFKCSNWNLSENCAVVDGGVQPFGAPDDVEHLLKEKTKIWFVILKLSFVLNLLFKQFPKKLCILIR
jgi:hypothetical protein